MNGIWIRTQDRKRLRLCNDIYANKKGKVSCAYDKEDDFIVGRYVSEERALEVLEEIQLKLRAGVYFFKMPTD